jgi:hypothetical protein
MAHNIFAEYEQDLVKLAAIIESCGPNHPSWTAIARKIKESDPVCDQLENARRCALTRESGEQAFNL